MPHIENLLEGYRQFYQKYYIENPETYKNLTEKGQTPHTLVIACSDSRVDPSIILNTGPGDIFVIRNVANLVPAYDSDFSHCHGTSAAIEYAVKHLKVKNILILGHTHCGGIHNLLCHPLNRHDFIDTWLSIAEEARREASKQTSETDRQHICEREAVRVSLRNLLTFPFVAEAVSQNHLKLHGWLFDLAGGSIEKLSL